MPASAESGDTLSYQARFERRWSHLTRPHVRALAWLLDSPDLLDAAAPYWHGRIATCGPAEEATARWLASLEDDPSPLDGALGGRFYSRLGLYAEKLMAFYYQQQGVLAAHGLQVRDPKATVGEFDFLLAEPAGLRHIEFATKFYLLDRDADKGDFDLLVGPNLGDTLGRKMRKIFEHQLELAHHPAAQAVLPGPVVAAQALVKGWLFHPPGTSLHVPGVAANHCRGGWHTLAAFADGEMTGERFVAMPRLQWLAPLKESMDMATVARGELAAMLAERFAGDASPVMVAAVREEGGWLLEESRAFVVRDDWPARAALRRQTGVKPPA